MLKLEAKSCITSSGQLSKWRLHQIKCRKVLSILVTTGKETNIEYGCDTKPKNVRDLEIRYNIEDSMLGNIAF